MRIAGLILGILRGLAGLGGSIFPLFIGGPGELAFKIPKDSKGLELIFEPNIFGFGQAIIKLNR